MSDGTNTNDQTDDAGKDDQAPEDVTGLKTALQSEREARKQLDKDLKQTQRDLNALKNAGKSETDKLTALETERAELLAKIRDRDAKDEARDAAKKAGAPDPDLVYRVVRSDIEFDSDGSPKNLKTLIDDLKTTTPHLFKPATSRVDGGAGNGSKPGKADMNSFIRVAAGREA